MRGNIAQRFNIIETPYPEFNLLFIPTDCFFFRGILGLLVLLHMRIDLSIFLKALLQTHLMILKNIFFLKRTGFVLMLSNSVNLPALTAVLLYLLQLLLQIP